MRRGFRPTIVRHPTAASQNVQNREQENPDYVHKMPIKPNAFQEPVARGSHLSHESPDQGGNEKEYPDENVHSVESGKHKETRPHDSRRIEPKSLGEQMAPFVRLVGQEE